MAARDREWDYEGYLEMHQERLNPKHLRQFSTLNSLHKFAQRTNQSVTELIAYLTFLEDKLEPPLDETNRFRFLYMALHPYLKEAVMKRETVVEGRTQLEKVAYLLEKTVTHATEQSYSVGDWVYLNRKVIKTTRPCRKLDWKFIGQYRVLEEYGKNAYRIGLGCAQC